MRFNIIALIMLIFMLQASSGQQFCGTPVNCCVCAHLNINVLLLWNCSRGRRRGGKGGGFPKKVGEVLQKTRKTSMLAVWKRCKYSISCFTRSSTKCLLTPQPLPLLFSLGTSASSFEQELLQNYRYWC